MKMRGGSGAPVISSFSSIISIILLLTVHFSPVLSNPIDFNSDASSIPHNTSLPYANHIFNLVHSALRQWGSSVNHNGLSYFIASVPAGAQLYHGRASAGPVKGFEWLAFEEEHAMLFARGNPGIKPDGGGEEYSLGFQSQKPLESDGEKASDDEDVERNFGYLHTFTTRHPLRLLYLDGMSAAKCPIGTMDSQDEILLNHTTKPRPGWAWWELERAEGLCELASSPEWGADGSNTLIQGFVRMEAGFEVILCDFERDMVQTRVQANKPGMDGVRGVRSAYDYLHVVSSRYNGLGRGRAQVHFGDFVSGFDWERYGADIWHDEEDSPLEKPRLAHVSSDVKDKLREDVAALVRSGVVPGVVDASDPARSVDWQAIADLYVARYSEKLSRWVSSPPSSRGFNTSAELATEIEELLRMYIDYEHPRNISLEIESCAMYFMPHLPPRNETDKPLAERAILSVATSICRYLFEAFDVVSLFLESNKLVVSPEPKAEAAEQEAESAAAEKDNDAMNLALTYLTQLYAYLDWTPFRYCHTAIPGTPSHVHDCPPDEFCFIPMWPLGTKEDYEHPQCVARDERFLPRPGERYWGPDGFAAAEVDGEVVPWVEETRRRLRILGDEL